MVESVCLCISPFSNILIVPRVIGFSTETVKYLMSVFVRALTSQARLKVDFLQDLNGNGEIGIEEVSGLLFVHGIKLTTTPSSSPCGIMSR
jgi:hypothetical protein